MILGILAAIALPRIVNVTGDATDNAVRQSLSSLRDAIDTFASQNHGEWPGDDEADLKSVLRPYLRGPFPRCPAGEGTADGVTVVSGGTSLSGTGGDGSAGRIMWKYDNTAGEIIIDDSAASVSGIPYDEF